MSETFIFKGDLMAKPRMTQSVKWNPKLCHLKYFAFKNAMVLQANLEQFVLPETYEFFAYIKMSDSWSKKKKAEYYLKEHKNKPDKDNIEKSINDIFCTNDSANWSIDGHKFWYTENVLIIRKKSDAEIERIKVDALNLITQC